MHERRRVGGAVAQGELLVQPFVVELHPSLQPR
jgi:hypothetical protein